MNEDNLSTLLGLPEYKSELVINGNFTISFVNPIPNAWFRFWTKIMFGWEWRSLRKDAKEE